ncbi:MULTISPECIES: hypothetical protein [unclassified Streptomyces]
MNPSLAAAPVTLGGWADIRLYRVTNSIDRLWHNQESGNDR